MHKLVLVLPVLLMSACASITGSKLQPLSVKTVQDNKEVAGVGCTLTNDTGQWFVTTPGTVTVQKSTADMAVNCKANDAAGQQNVVSKANGAVWGNILAGGIIGYAVDRNTGAGFDYPGVVTVFLNTVSEKLGVNSQAPQQAAK